MNNAIEYKEKRINSKRKNMQQPEEVELIGSSSQSKGYILEYSEDGSGCYIETNNNCLINGEIQIKVKDSIFSGKIAHKNARLLATLKNKERIVKGVGIRIIDNYSTFSGLLKKEESAIVS